MPSITVTIHDEHTRRALESALWDCVHSVVADDITTAPLYEASQDIARSCDPSATTKEAQMMVEELARARRQIDVVKAAQPGERVSLEIDPAALARGLKSCLYALEYAIGEWQELPARPIEQRNELLRTRDAAAHLLEQLPKSAAVA